MIRFTIAILALACSAVLGCGGPAGVSHSDYGDCNRTARHRHNDHVFVSHFHDHALCLWLAYE